jgi:hypothetical protein
MVLTPGNFLENASFKNEMASRLTSWCKFRFSVIVREKVLKASAITSGSFTSSSFKGGAGICSARYNYPVSCFIIFQVVFIWLSDFTISPQYYCLLASFITLLRIFQYLMQYALTCGLLLFLLYIVVYRPIAGQRSRNERVQQLLRNRWINTHFQYYIWASCCIDVPWHMLS